LGFSFKKGPKLTLRQGQEEAGLKMATPRNRFGGVRGPSLEVTVAAVSRGARYFTLFLFHHHFFCPAAEPFFTLFAQGIDFQVETTGLGSLAVGAPSKAGLKPT